MVNGTARAAILRSACQGPKRALLPQATPVIAGLAVGAAAYAGKTAIELFTKFRSAPPRLRQFYKVGSLELSFLMSNYPRSC